MGKRKQKKEIVNPDVPKSIVRVKVKIGKTHQAVIPECRARGESSDDSDREPDVLMWSPYVLPEEVVMAYEAKDRDGEKASTSGNVPDNEEALHDLLKVNYNVEEAEKLRKCKKMKEAENRRRFLLKHGNKEDYKEPFTRQERDRFEQGLKEFNKDFQKIRTKYLPNKTMHEIIGYYYRRKVTKKSRTTKTKVSTGRHKYGAIKRQRRGDRRDGAGGSQDN